MTRATPSWWYRRPGIMAVLLSPVSLVWRWVAGLRWSLARPYRSTLPVICVGNLTAGGAGKTPAALAIARMLQQEGLKPAFLTRGYGGTKKGPHLVDRALDTANDVGDEPMLLARVAATVVSADRAKGARLIETLKADLIIMDDGFQNPGVSKNYVLLVLDRARGIGNGHVIPSGPLRADLNRQLPRAQAIIAVGKGTAGDAVIEKAKSLDLTIFDAEIRPKDRASWLKEKPIVAFAGIGDPAKFFATIETLGGTISQRMVFEDHHAFSHDDANTLQKLAGALRAQLVTTEKDMARIEGNAALDNLKRTTRALPIRMMFKDQGRLKRHIMRATGKR